MKSSSSSSSLADSAPADLTYFDISYFHSCRIFYLKQIPINYLLSGESKEFKSFHEERKRSESSNFVYFELNSELKSMLITLMAHEANAVSLSWFDFLSLFSCRYFEGVKFRSPSNLLIDIGPLVNRQSHHYLPAHNSLLAVAHQRILSPLFDLLIIGDLNSGVGCGLFARRLIPFGTCIGIYSGEFYSDQELSTDEQVPIAAFSYRCYGVDGSASGGLSRFCQHLPFSSNVFSRYLIKKLRDPKLFALERNITVDAATQILTPEYVERKTKEIMSGDIGVPSSEADFERIKFFDSPEIGISALELRNSVATANIGMMRTSLAQYGFSSNSNVIAMIALTNIEPGHLLGFDYGQQYWNNKRMKELVPSGPCLFNRFGQIIDSKLYEYKIFNQILNKKPAL